MAQESMEVKVAKMETKIDTILSILNELKEADKDKVTRRELDELKVEVRRKTLKNTLLAAALACVITTLVSYVIFDVLGG
jgi:hypothetical protein